MPLQMLFQQIAVLKAIQFFFQLLVQLIAHLEIRSATSEVTPISNSEEHNCSSQNKTKNSKIIVCIHLKILTHDSIAEVHFKFTSSTYYFFL